MNVEDFLPKYPNVDKSTHPVLDPYDEGFYSAIYRKKEFYENRLEKIEAFPSERGVLMKHQQTIARFLSSHTPYDRLLLVHAMGSGKTCSAIGAIEQIRLEGGTIDGAIIVAKGEGLLDNFVNELLFRCTGGDYIPDNFDKLTPGQKAQRIRKNREGYYTLKTMQKFSKEIKATSVGNLTAKYSNKIIVIDEVHNLRIQPEKKKETLEVYQQFHRLLHNVRNCKILLMSGTPMKDRPDEIASVMNLLLPDDKQLPYGNDFVEQFLDVKDDVYTVKPQMVPRLKNAFKGRVSFLRAMYSSVKKVYLGKSIGTLKHLIVTPDGMSKFQSKAYANAYQRDRSGKQGVYSNSREAVLAVYPDGSWGSAGFKKYIVSKKRKSFDIRMSGGKQKKEYKMKYSLTPEFKQAIVGSTTEETIDNIAKYSSKYAAVIRQILDRKDQCCFVYSSVVHGSGAILFSLLMELLGYTKASGKETSKSPRYSILTGETSSKKELQRIRDRFNNPDNMFGEYIQVIIGSRTVSEGLSFKHMQFEAIMTPHFNYSETAQALARGIRLGSHNDLLAAGVNPTVSIMQPVSIPRPRQKRKYDLRSIDLYLYELSEDKDVSIRHILRIIMESAFDCALNYYRNHIEGKDGSRECDYTTCDYKCDGVNMRAVQEGLDNSELDYSTYQLYYANPYTTKIQKRIENLLRQNIKMDLDSVFKNLEGEYSEWQIRNALQTLTEQIEGEDFDYRQFLQVYSRSSVKKIMNTIEGMFQQHFYLDIQSIASQLPQYTQFEILTALSTMINENVIIFNRYGFPSYLKEEYNIYFLVNNLAVADNFLSGYYTEYPNVLPAKSYGDILVQLYEQSLPGLVRKICQATKKQNFINLIKTVPSQVQEIFVEAALSAKDKKITKNSHVQKFILEYFKNYISKIGTTLVSTLREGDEVVRCKEVGADYSEWKNCPPGYAELVRQTKKEQMEKKRAENPYGIVGLVNPENDEFCLIDVTLEQKSKSRLKGKKKGSTIEDTRAVHTGKRCASWKLPQLLNIVVDRLKIDPPTKFKTVGDAESLRNQISKNKKFKYARGVFSQEDLANRDAKELRRIMYWTTTPGEGGSRGVKPICAKLRAWLEERDLIVIDNMCGVQVKTRLTEEKKDLTKKFRVETIVPKRNPTAFKEMKELEPLMKQCFKIDKFDYKLTTDTWVFAYIRKLVAFAIVRDGKIIRACVAPNYRRRKGMAITAMGAIVKDSGISVIQMDNRDKNYNMLLRAYKSYGFSVTKDTGTITTLEYTGGKK